MGLLSKWRHKLAKWLGLDDTALKDMKLGDLVAVVLGIKDWFGELDDEYQFKVGELKETIRNVLREIGKIV